MTAIIILVGTDHIFKVLGPLLFEILAKKHMRHMAKIWEDRKYALFRLYLTITPGEPVYERFYGDVNIVPYIGKPTDCPGHAWCAPSMPKMTNKVDVKFVASGHFASFLVYYHDMECAQNAFISILNCIYDILV